MSAGRFPADEPLSDLGMRQSRTVVVPQPVQRVLAGPETRTRQTAEACGWQPDIDGALADLDCGRWRGKSPGGLEPAELHRWMADPASTPHGGESITALLDRTANWLDTVTRTPGRVVAVTHPAVIRAAILTALDAPPESFWRIDVEPASRTVLHHRHHWTLRTTPSFG